MDVVGFVESRCGQGTVIQNEIIREVMEENQKKALSKLDFVFYYKSFARTDLVTNQMQIHIALKFTFIFGNYPLST